MEPKNFREANVCLQPPQGHTGPEVISNLYVWTNGRECVSCWRLGFWERVKLLWSGVIWLRILSGRTQPPVALETTKNPFEP